MSAPIKLWSPNEEFSEKSNLSQFMQYVNKQYNCSYSNYQELWKWSVDAPSDFWLSITKFFNIQYSGSFSEVMTTSDKMYETKWFEGTQLNYAEHVFSNESTLAPAIVFKSETNTYREIGWDELKSQTAAIANYLKSCGVQKGDRVCSMLPNVPEAIVAFLAVNSIGAVWSSCSPDFGTKSIIDRFQQIEPKVFISTNAYSYNGKIFSKVETAKEIISNLPSLSQVIAFNFIENSEDLCGENIQNWDKIIANQNQELIFERVDFSDPIWILYSSGTTGKPKAITHSVGGITIEHYKAMGLHQNVKPGERFFWYSTTGWMMWNYAVSALLVGGTVAVYEGAPAYPSKESLWNFAEQAKVEHFGAGASYYIFCMKEDLNFTDQPFIQNIKSFGSTGSPLPPEAFHWFYSNVKKDAWVISLSGGTDICSGFVGGNPLEPVYEGEIQCRMLGVNLRALSETGESVEDELGEMVIETPMPSMPIYFWNDKNNERYASSYFEMYPGKWRHGDWIKITPRHTLIIYGRSDATLNRGGVRIGTSEVYSAANSVEEIKDSLVVCLDNKDGSQFMPLFIVLQEGVSLTEELSKKIKTTIRTQFSPRHVPDQFVVVQEIPYTISGKKMETPVKKILSGIPIEKAASVDAMKNPESLNFFVEYNK